MRLRAIFAAAATFASGCVAVAVDHGSRNPVVGAWIVKYDKAPFPFHMQVFNADGTMQQANPDAGHAGSSDSDGKGIWIAEGDHIRGKWVEITADRATHGYTGRGEIAYVLKVTGDRLEGTAEARFYDPAGKLVDGPIETPMSGERVTLP
ncbi:MAG: hypothetical protein QM773_11425 [Hyphomonadaceae bacterium]